MSESSVSEHGFNLRDAEHERGTNRYVFKYPEVWYSSSPYLNLTFGLRSIILKPDPVDINLSGLQIANVSAGFKLAPYLQIVGDLGKITAAYDRPRINGDVIYPDRLPMYLDQEVNEGTRMTEVCEGLNNGINNEITRYQSRYKDLKSLFDATFTSSKLPELRIDYKSVHFTFTRNREFIMETSFPESYKFLAVYNEMMEDPTEITHLILSDPVQTEYMYNVECFTKDFEKLLTLNFEEGVSLNNILSGLAGIDSRLPIEEAKALCNKYGIRFDGVQLINYPIEAEYVKKVDGTYDISQPKSLLKYACCVVFTRFVATQVWSRKDLLIRSSIAEMDTRSYLGYSTMTTSSPVCIYASPKMYPIESSSYKFWVDLYDSYNEDLVELPDNCVLIIEAALYLNPKVQFNRY